MSLSPPLPHPSRLRRARPAAAALLATGLLTAGLVATPGAAQARPPAPAPSSAVPVSTADYLPGVSADLYLPGNLPRHARTAPLVVTIPGGAWIAADRGGLGQLAEAFAAEGVATYNATYRIGDGVLFPVPAQDIRCAVDAGVQALRARGLRAEPVVVLGHSSGAHLSSLAAFGNRDFRAPGCPYPPSRIDGWVGLSGIYDVRLVGSYAWPMMGATQEEDPAGYARAATETYLADHGRPQLRALVVHGEADELIPPSVSSDFAALLRQHGYRTQLTLVPGADHQAIYQAPVVADVVLDWLRTVRPGPAVPPAPPALPWPVPATR